MKKFFILLLCSLQFFAVSQTPFRLYGVTGGGGTYNAGVLYSYDPINNIYNVKVNFDVLNGCGANSGIMQANNGKIYGVTQLGGIYNKGVLFEYDWVSDTLIKKFDFDSINGSEPFFPPVQALNGKLYATTFGGGIYNDYGVLYEFDPITNIFSKKIDFDSTVMGEHGESNLILANNGKIYGMNREGGVYKLGTLFEYDYTTNTLTKKHDWGGDSTGCLPKFDGLIQASSGEIYGINNNCGKYGRGIIFQYDIALDSCIKKFDFNYADGELPYCGLVQHTNGKLYGLASEGGLTGYGVLFEYDYTTNTYTKKVELFDYWSWSSGQQYGCFPIGTMAEGPNGKLYGNTNAGGIGSNYGLLFEFDPSSGVYTKKLDFVNTNGGNGSFGPMIILDTTLNSIPIKQDHVFEGIYVYPNPTSEQFFIDAQTTDKVNVDLHAGNGRHVFSKIVSDKSHINVSTLDNGIYTLSIRTVDRAITKKLVIIH